MIGSYEISDRRAMPLVSVTSGSYDCSWHDLPSLLPEFAKVELYLPHDKDLLPSANTETNPPSPTAALADCDVDVLADKILDRLGDRVVAVSTFLPGLTSANPERARVALGALDKAMELCDRLGAQACEAVGGRLAEMCREKGQRGPEELVKCEAIIFDAKRPSEWRAEKIGWLRDGAGAIWHKVVNERAGTRRANVRLAWELEHGPHFVLDSAASLSALLELTDGFRVPFVGATGADGDSEYRLSALNCDIGHALLLDSDMTPGRFWGSVFQGGKLGRPSEQLAGFHLSDQPYNCLHVDQVPCDGGWNNLSTRWHIQHPNRNPGFVPWLNCACCVQAKCPSQFAERMHISLELEGSSDPFQVGEGLSALRGGLEELLENRKDWLDEFGQRFCSGCPDYEQA